MHHSDTKGNKLYVKEGKYWRGVVAAHPPFLLLSMPSKAELYSQDTENTACWTSAQEETHHAPIPASWDIFIIGL